MYLGNKVNLHHIQKKGHQLVAVKTSIPITTEEIATLLQRKFQVESPYAERERERDFEDENSSVGRRFAVVGKTTGEIMENLKSRIIISPIVPILNSSFEAPKIAFLFTGQGSQYAGMAKNLYETCAVFQKSFDTCAEILSNNLPISLYDVIWGNNTACLDESLYSQTAIFSIEYALLQLWRSIGLKPDFVLGPSAGAFCAAVAAGILSLEDALKLVSERGKLIQNLPIGGMTSVKATATTVEKILDICFGGTVSDEPWLDIAVINSPDDIVVSGRPKNLEKFEKYCSESGIKTLRLAACQAFHSREIDSIRDDYGRILENVVNMEPACGYISGVLGKPLSASDFNASYWQSHARDPVDFPASINTLYNLGCTVFVEVGSHPTLVTVGKHNLGTEKAEKSIWLSSLKRNEPEWDTFLSNVGKLHAQGFNLNWKFLEEN